MPGNSQFHSSLVALLVLASCAPSTTNDSNATETSSANDGGSDETSRWQIGSSTDPMNDNEITSAHRSLQTGEFTIDVTISCGAKSPLTYEFRAFDSAGEAAPFRWVRGRGGVFVDRYFEYRIRLDQGTAFGAGATDTEYSNVFTIADDVLRTPAADLAQAQTVLIRAPLLNGEATIEINQENPDLRDFLQPCAQRDLAKRYRPISAVAEEPVASDSDDEGASAINQMSDDTVQKPAEAAPPYPSLQTVPVPQPSPPTYR